MVRGSLSICEETCLGLLAFVLELGAALPDLLLLREHLLDVRVDLVALFFHTAEGQRFSERLNQSEGAEQSTHRIMSVRSRCRRGAPFQAAMVEEEDRPWLQDVSISSAKCTSSHSEQGCGLT